MGALTVSEKAKHLLLTGKLEAAAERNSLLRSFCLGRKYQELPKVVGGWRNIEGGALERAHGLAAEKLLFVNSPFGHFQAG